MIDALRIMTLGDWLAFIIPALCLILGVYLMAALAAKEEDNEN